MSALLDRFTAEIARIGEDVTWTKLNGATVGTVIRCVVRPLDSGNMNSFLDSVEQMGVVKPGLLVEMAGSGSSVTVGDGFTRDGRAFVVLKTFPFRFNNELIYTRVLLS